MIFKGQVDSESIDRRFDSSLVVFFPLPGDSKGEKASKIEIRERPLTRIDSIVLNDGQIVAAKP